MFGMAHRAIGSKIAWAANCSHCLCSLVLIPRAEEGGIPSPQLRDVHPGHNDIAAVCSIIGVVCLPDTLTAQWCSSQDFSDSSLRYPLRQAYDSWQAQEIGRSRDILSLPHRHQIPSDCRARTRPSLHGRSIQSQQSKIRRKTGQKRSKAMVASGRTYLDLLLIHIGGLQLISMG